MNIFGLFDSDPDHLTIGGVEFVKLDSLSESSHLEDNDTKDVCDGVNLVATLYDSKQSSDYHNWHPNVLKADKLKEFDQLYRSKKIHQISHRYLKHIGFKFGKILERTIDFKEDLILVSMKIKQYETQQEKEIKKNPPAIKDGTASADTKTAGDLKSNQAETEKSKVDGILRLIDNGLKRLWE